MSRRKLGTMGILLSLLAIPSTGHASIIDIIWGMSGPQMIGLVSALRDRSGAQGRDEEQRRHRVPWRRLPVRTATVEAACRCASVWLSLDAARYFSTGQGDSDGYALQEVQRPHGGVRAHSRNQVLYEPGEEFHAASRAHGGHLRRAFGESFDTFDNVGLSSGLWA